MNDNNNIANKIKFHFGTVKHPEHGVLFEGVDLEVELSDKAYECAEQNLLSVVKLIIPAVEQKVSEFVELDSTRRMQRLQLELGEQKREQEIHELNFKDAMEEYKASMAEYEIRIKEYEEDRARFEKSHAAWEKKISQLKEGAIEPFEPTFHQSRPSRPNRPYRYC